MFAYSHNDYYCDQVALADLAQQCLGHIQIFVRVEHQLRHSDPPADQADEEIESPDECEMAHWCCVADQLIRRR